LIDALYEVDGLEVLLRVATGRRVEAAVGPRAKDAEAGAAGGLEALEGRGHVAGLAGVGVVDRVRRRRAVGDREAGLHHHDGLGGGEVRDVAYVGSALADDRAVVGRRHDVVGVGVERHDVEVLLPVGDRVEIEARHVEELVNVLGNVGMEVVQRLQRRARRRSLLLLLVLDGELERLDDLRQEGPVAPRVLRLQHGREHTPADDGRKVRLVEFVLDLPQGYAVLVAMDRGSCVSIEVREVQLLANDVGIERLLLLLSRAR